MGCDGMVVAKLFQVSRDTVLMQTGSDGKEIETGQRNWGKITMTRQRNWGKDNCGKAKELWQGKGIVAKEL